MYYLRLPHLYHRVSDLKMISLVANHYVNLVFLKDKKCLFYPDFIQIRRHIKTRFHRVTILNSNSISITDSTSIEFMSRGVSDVYYYCLPYFYGMTHVSKVGSVFTTLAVSLERYFAVCRPLWIRIRRCHPSFYIILVNVFAFAFNIPKFLEFEVS